MAAPATDQCHFCHGAGTDPWGSTCLVCGGDGKVDAEIIAFEVGESYATRSACDYDNIMSYTILSRTAKTVMLKSYCNDTAVRRIQVYDGVEQFRPNGNYSMCPVIRADMPASSFPD